MASASSSCKDLAAQTLREPARSKCISSFQCAFDMHVNIPQEPLDTDIYKKNAAAQLDPRSGTRSFCEHFTRATLHGNLQEKCCSPDWAQNADRHFVRACAVQMHLEISQEPLKFAGKMPRPSWSTLIYPDQAPAFTTTVRTPECGHTVLGKILQKVSWFAWNGLGRDYIKLHHANPNKEHLTHGCLSLVFRSCRLQTFTNAKSVVNHTANVMTEPFLYSKHLEMCWNTDTKRVRLARSCWCAARWRDEAGFECGRNPFQRWSPCTYKNRCCQHRWSRKCDMHRNANILRPSLRSTGSYYLNLSSAINAR